MKKYLIFAICAVMLCACGKKKEEEAAEPTITPTQAVEQQTEENAEATAEPVAEPVPAEKGTVAVTSDGDNVKVTMPAELFGTDVEKTVNVIKEKRGFKDISIDGDKVIFSITKQQHAEWLEDTGNNIKNNVNTIMNNANYPEIKNIELNDDFTQVTIKVDKASYRSDQVKIAADGIAQLMLTYQSCNGVAVDALAVAVTVCDNGTGETIETFNF